MCLHLRDIVARCGFWHPPGARNHNIYRDGSIFRDNNIYRDNNDDDDDDDDDQSPSKEASTKAFEGLTNKEAKHTRCQALRHEKESESESDRERERQKANRGHLNERTTEREGQLDRQDTQGSQSAQLHNGPRTTHVIRPFLSFHHLSRAEVIPVRRIEDRDVIVVYVIVLRERPPYGLLAALFHPQHFSHSRCPAVGQRRKHALEPLGGCRVPRVERLFLWGQGWELENRYRTRVKPNRLGVPQVLTCRQDGV